jgi:hypothetical protein
MVFVQDNHWSAEPGPALSRLAGFAPKADPASGTRFARTSISAWIAAVAAFAADCK